MRGDGKEEVTRVKEAPNNNQRSAPSAVHVHWKGGGCHAMFRGHAQAMTAKGVLRCVLLDLPGP